MVPTDKLTAAGVAAAAVAVLAWVLESLGVTMPPAVQTAVAVCLVWLAGYVKTERGTLAAALASRRQGKHE
jgi:hypothetical protein